MVVPAAGEHGAGFDEARSAARGLGSALAPAPVTVPVGEALGTVLAAPLHALGDVPAADASAMDGFAVRGPGPWRVVGQALAGAGPSAPLDDGHAVEVATGALVPAGTDRVLPVEVVRLVGAAAGADAVVHLDGTPPDRRHVRPRGEECSAGEPLLPAGRRVVPGVLGLAASTGSDCLQVRRRPRVAALLTGDEVVAAGLPVPGQVRDAVGPLLPGAVASLGGDLVALERCGDAPGELDAALERLGSGGADVLLTCGMAGSGPADRLRPWLARTGARLVVDGVEVRPGHPMLLASLPGGTPLVGLPGNPLAAVAALLGLLGPLLDGLSGLTPPVRAEAVLTDWEPRGRPATVLLPVRRRPDGAVEPAG
ncbi:molybdopterin molybdotransferase MoeA, partial [Aquipuribacter hungaricus]